MYQQVNSSSILSFICVFRKPQKMNKLLKDVFPKKSLMEDTNISTKEPLKML